MLDFSFLNIVFISILNNSKTNTGEYKRMMDIKKDKKDYYLNQEPTGNPINSPALTFN